jgi:folate-binding Fe-S cluster repair protein YgfZ
VLNFGYPADELMNARRGLAKCPLLSFGLVRFAGGDARTFINAQFTTNCLALDAQHSQLSGWCDPKGRVLNVFVLYTDGEHFFAVIPRAQIDRFTARLRMYVLRAQVSVEDVSDQYCLFGLATGTAPDSRDLAEPWASTVGAAGQFVIR